MDRCTRAATRTGTEDGGDAQCEQGKVEWVNSPKPPGVEATRRGVQGVGASKVGLPMGWQEGGDNNEDDDDDDDDDDSDDDGDGGDE